MYYGYFIRHLTYFLGRFNEIQVTDPSSQTNGILSARIDTRIKLCVTFRSSSILENTENTLSARRVPWNRAILEVLFGTERSWQSDYSQECL